MKRFVLVGLVALLVLSLAAPARARWGTVHFSAVVSSRGEGPASDLVVRAHPHERVAFVFSLRRGGQGPTGPLVVRGTGGTEMFDARYFVMTRDGWVPVTHEIKREHGLFVGSGGWVEATVKLVVATHSGRWGWHYEHTFTVSAGDRSEAKRQATATVLA